MPIHTIIGNALTANSSPILIYPMVYGDAGATAVRVHHTVYIPPMFVLILLDGKLSLVEA